MMYFKKCTHIWACERAHQFLSQIHRLKIFHYIQKICGKHGPFLNQIFDESPPSITTKNRRLPRVAAPYASNGHRILSSWMLQYAASLSLVSWQSIIEREEEAFSSPGMLSTGPFIPPGHLPSGRMLSSSAAGIATCGKCFL